MSEKIRKLKEDASRLIAKGKLEEACDCYEKVVKLDPRDLTARQKLAEIYGRLGRTERAVHVYQSVAGCYAADGLLLKAIAVCKIILQIDPAHTETQAILADLSTKRRGGGTQNVVEMPKAMSAALASSGKKSASSIRGVSANQIRGAAPAQLHGVPSIPLDDSSIEIEIEIDSRLALTPVPSSVAAVSLAAVTVSPALGRSPATSIEELSRSAASMLPEALPPIVTGRAMPDDISIEISFDDAEPVVVGAPHERPSLAGAPILTTAIYAVLPSFDEMMATTPGYDLTAAAAAVVGVAAPAPPAPDPFADVVEAEDDFGNLDAVANRTAGKIVSSSDEVGFDLTAAAIADDEAAGVADTDDGDDGDILDLDDDDVHAQIDVDRVPPIPLFSDLPRDAFVALTERMDLRVATTGETLITESEPGTSMFVIIQGRVKVTRTDDDGEEIVLAQLADGTFFGEMALLSDAPRTASVVCTEETMLFEISRELVEHMTTHYPSVGEVMKKFHKNRLITNLLKTSPIFSPFSTNDKKALIETFKSRDVVVGSYLITREKPGDGLYVVLSGRCEVLDRNANGTDVIIAELREGDVFGEMSMLWNKETCASVRATTTCTVLRLPRSSFTEVIMTHPQILETLSVLSEKRHKSNVELNAAGIASEFLL